MDNYNLKQSVTLLFQCKDEFFFIKRSKHLVAFPGYTSFVGGKIEKQDSEVLESKAAEESNNTIADKLNIPLNHLNALQRESLEEVGYDILMHKNIQLQYVGVATTPRFQKSRFQNYYYIIKLEQKFETIPNGEIEIFYWKNLKELFEEDHMGGHLMVPPTRELLRRIKDKEINLSLDLNLQIEDNKVPEVGFIHGIQVLMPLSNTLPPAVRTNCFYMGDEKKILVDPAPKDEKELARFKRTLNNRKVDLIFLTHHHIDHFENSAIIAAELNVPIGLSQKTYNRIESEHRNYFKDTKTLIFKEGDILCTVNSKKVIVYAVPGHASGQLALIAEDFHFGIVSDLIHGQGTIIIAPPDGNMCDYFKSLQRMINLNLKVVFPSHGIALGGDSKITQTLEHRKSREDAIRALHKAGKSETQIREELYSHLAPENKLFAILTIEAHLDKIDSEG